VHAGDLLHVSRGGDDFRINRSDLVKTFLSQIADAAITGATNGHSLIYNAVTSKWENGFVSWAMVSGKPSQFTPVAHTHSWVEITDAPTELPAVPHTHPWSDLTGVPSSFPPDPHIHGWDDLTDVPAVFPPETHAHAWAEITDKPTEFPPEVHSHASLYYSKTELNASGAGGQVHWDNITSKPTQFGTGDMSRSVYDQNEDGIVNAADSVPWSGITGTPATFPPEAHDHDDRYFTETELSQSGAGGSVHWDNITGKPTAFGGDMAKAVYDLDDDGIVDSAASVPWAGVTGKPATFPPSAHNHDDLYSLLGHNHDGSYSVIGHNHNDLYSLLGHNHDADYAALDHTHAQYLIDAPSDGKTYGRKNGVWAEAANQVRERLTADRTYYVSPTGSDSNNGLTSGTPFATIQKAINTVASIDLTTYDVTIQLADGTYTGAAVINGTWVGSGTVTIKGNAGAPANVLLSTGTATAIQAYNGAAVTVQDLKITTIGGSANGLLASNGASIQFTNLNFGAIGLAQVRAEDGAVITVIGNYQITGGATYHYNATAGIIRCQSRAITISNTPAFSNTYAFAQMNGTLIANTCTFSGTGATGTRYNVTGNSVIFTNSGGATYFPGSVAGTTSAGGQYL
jgi:hypothetical protein